MNQTIIATLIMAVLGVAAGLYVAREDTKREAAEKALADATQKLNQTGDVLAEVRALRQDVSGIEASVKALGQKRNEAGEKRRENIKTELAGDPCAAALVPDAVADSLYQRAAEVAAGDHSGAFARKPDGKN
ncbi:TPA: DUF2570 domain-containing protein [Klebsiella pneumoniae]|nr:DUF2570 domain-containing protein [Klebsiella pneumoniae]